MTLSPLGRGEGVKDALTLIAPAFCTATAPCYAA